MVTVDFISRRKEIEKERADLQKKIDALMEEMEVFDKEIAAMQAYEAVMAGEAIGTSPNNRSRGTRVSRKDAILNALSAKSMSRAELLAALKVKGNKSAEASVSNALSTMKKAGHITQDGGGLYAVAS